MAPTISITELKKMQIPDLEREIFAQRTVLAKMSIAVAMRQEKDTAKLRREKRALARMLTVLRSSRIS